MSNLYKLTEAAILRAKRKRPHQPPTLESNLFAVYAMFGRGLFTESMLRGALQAEGVTEVGEFFNEFFNSPNVLKVGESYHTI